MKSRLHLGATAVVNLPTLGIEKLRARVDTGAATCALHASFVEIDEQHDVLKVVLFDPDHELYTGEELTFNSFVVRNVRNSFGRKHARPMVETRIELLGQEHEVLIGFSNRSKLTYDMLIGRNLLELGYLVDVSK